MKLSEKIDAARRAIQHQAPDAAAPEVGIILGTGLGGLADRIEDAVSIPYSEVPHFAPSDAPSHAGNLVLGRISGKPVIAFQGRWHVYDGYSPEEITFPVRVTKALGAHTLIVSNACGGMNPQYRQGDLMIMEDHINLLGINPLIGPNDDSLGPRWPDMCEPYDRALQDLAEQVALEQGVKTHRGVYVAVAGPCLETRAEYRFLRIIGADVVGMSTVPEVIVAIHGGLRCLGFSIITDECFPDALKPANVEEIIATANRTEPILTGIVEQVIARLDRPA